MEVRANGPAPAAAPRRWQRRSWLLAGPACSAAAVAACVQLGSWWRRPLRLVANKSRRGSKQPDDQPPPSVAAAAFWGSSACLSHFSPCCFCRSAHDVECVATQPAGGRQVRHPLLHALLASAADLAAAGGAGGGWHACWQLLLRSAAAAALICRCASCGAPFGHLPAAAGIAWAAASARVAPVPLPPAPLCCSLVGSPRHCPAGQVVEYDPVTCKT